MKEVEAVSVSTGREVGNSKYSVPYYSRDPKGTIISTTTHKDRTKSQPQDDHDLRLGGGGCGGIYLYIGVIMGIMEKNMETTI